MDFNPHPTPRMRDVLPEQIRVVGLSLRREALVVAVVLTLVSVVIAFDVARGTAATWFDSDSWAHFGLLALIFPFAVWRRESRFGPAFLWTLPIDRRSLALAKVFAGWVWLMAALGIILLWQCTLAAVSHVADAEVVGFAAFPGATAVYLLASALVLGLRHPVRWVLGTVGLLLLLGFLDEGFSTLDRFVTLDQVCSAIVDARTAWQRFPHAIQAVLPSVLFLAAGFVALWLAVSRHGERRRH